MASNFVAFFSRDKVLAIQITYTVYRYTDDCTLADFEFLRVKVDVCKKMKASWRMLEEDTIDRCRWRKLIKDV